MYNAIILCVIFEEKINALERIIVYVELGDKLGLSREESQNIGKYLIQRGFLKYQSLISAKITAKGIDEIEMSKAQSNGIQQKTNKELMMITELLKSQKNELLEIIKKTGLEPFNFNWKKAKSRFNENKYVDKLEHQTSAYYYVFDTRDEKHFATYSPGESILVTQAYPGSWDLQKTYFEKWLGFLSREIQQPDLWSEISKYQIENSTVSDDTTNDPFTFQQTERITDGLNKIRDYLQENVVAEENRSDLVNEKLDYLIDAAKRQGRKDWMHTCIGVFVGLAMNLALTPDQVNHIWLIMKSAISGIVHFLP